MNIGVQMWIKSRTVLPTNKVQTNKGQNTFFKNIYSRLIRDKCWEIFVQPIKVQGLAKRSDNARYKVPLFSAP